MMDSRRREVHFDDRARSTDHRDDWGRGKADPTQGIGHRIEDNQTTETNNLGTMDIKTGTMDIKTGIMDIKI